VVTDLLAALVEIEANVAARGWDQPPRLFALADSADLAVREPALAAALGIDGRPGLTPIEQDGVPVDRALDDVLGAIMWPDAVVGAVVAVERIVLPPDAEDELPEDGAAAAHYASEHPARTDVRVVGGVLRDGTQHAVLRVRGHDEPSDLMTGPEIAPALLTALAGTFAES
jgi:hypothetical protein